MAILDIDNISFNYSDKAVIKNLSFKVAKGDFVCVVGTNGTGKSTLLKLILNLLKPDKGNIYIDGVNTKDFKNFERLSYVSQKAASFNSDFPATVEEVVLAGLYPKYGFLRFGKKEERIGKAIKALSTVGMREYAHKLIGRLSGGQQQRVFIAKALVNDPDVIFLDEPTVGIDVKAVDSICCLLGELNKKLGITIIMVTHDISSVIYHSNKILQINDDASVRIMSSEEFEKETIGGRVHHC